MRLGVDGQWRAPEEVRNRVESEPQRVTRKTTGSGSGDLKPDQNDQNDQKPKEKSNDQRSPEEVEE